MPEEIDDWETRYPSENIAIITGAISSIFCLDEDPGGRSTIAAYGGVPDTVSAFTPRGGLHHIFRYPGFHVPTLTKFLPDIDLRGDGGYIIATPSVSSDGRRYQWRKAPWEGEIAEAPSWLLDWIQEYNQQASEVYTPPVGPLSAPSNSYGTTALDRQLLELQASQPGERNAKLNAAAYTLARLVAGNVLDLETVEMSLWSTARSLSTDVDPFPDKEIARTLKSAIRAGLKKPRTPHPLNHAVPAGKRKTATILPIASVVENGQSHAITVVEPAGPQLLPPDDVPPTEDPEPDDNPSPRFTLDDAGNSHLFVQHHGFDVLYNYKHGKWLGWTGKQWLQDDGGIVFERAKTTLEDRSSDLRSTADHLLFSNGGKAEREAKEIFGHAKYCGGAKAVQNCLWMTRTVPHIAISLDELDRNPLLFNTLSGTYNLETHEWHDHQRSDRITKLSPVQFDPLAEAPIFEQFLVEILPDEGVRDFILRGLGYSLCGLTHEQCFFLLTGTGRNGKGTLVDTVLDLLGDYASTTPFDTFVLKKFDHGPMNDLAALVGARFVAASEGKEGAKLDEQVLKSLTGEEPITCRFFRQEFFTYKPTFKPWLITNHNPRVSQDFSFWRRVRPIHFPVQIPDDKIDHHLRAKLRLELPGILNHLLRGWQRYRSIGLILPAAIQAHKDAYKRDEDVLGRFLEDITEPTVTGFITMSKLYDEFRKWCTAEGEYQFSNREMAKRLRERGWQSIKSESHRWVGFCLKADTKMIADTEWRTD
jgi:putative DNA primase/helicase